MANSRYQIILGKGLTLKPRTRSRLCKDLREMQDGDLLGTLRCGCGKVYKLKCQRLKPKKDEESAIAIYVDVE